MTDLTMPMCVVW